jgi:uroporphyrin-3 C-methyltransferase
MNDTSDRIPEETQAVTAPEESARPNDEPQARPDGGVSWAGRLALPIAVLAAAGAGYLWYEQRNAMPLSGQLGGVQTAVNTQAAELQGLSAKVQALLDDEKRLTTDVQNLRGPLERQLEEIPLRIQRLETALENVPGVADKARSAWLVAETEYFLRIANSQLSLAGDVDVALSAMAIADEKLRDLADPRLTPVRARLSDERAALKALARPDSEGIVLTLGSLSRNIDKFPLANGVPVRFGDDGGPDGAESGLDRAWRVIAESLSGIISVKKSTEVAVAPIMSSADEIMLRRALDMEMQIARIAVIRSQGRLFKDSVESLIARLNRYFDPEDPAVIAALSTLDEMRETRISNDLPDISGSLSLLLELDLGAATP